MAMGFPTKVNVKCTSPTELTSELLIEVPRVPIWLKQTLQMRVIQEIFIRLLFSCDKEDVKHSMPSGPRLTFDAKT